MITIIDYGMGNLRSVEKAFLKFYPDVKVSSSYKDILSSDKIVLPGVGAFTHAMEELEKLNMAGVIKEAIAKDKPFLGICLGLQLLFQDSEESSSIKGLGILKGSVRKFDNINGLKVPHMGWNVVKSKIKNQKSKIFDGIKDNSYMYFVHSYYVDCEEKDAIFCETDYGITFTSGINRKNMYAFQFHPEKSQSLGLKIIENFVKI